MRRIFQSLFLVLLGSLLAACASSPAGAVINIQSAGYLNPDINGTASPVVVEIYQLKSPFSFQNASYAALSANSAAVLGGDLVDKKTLEIRPGEQKSLNLSLAQDAQYIGVVAGYRRINESNWHSVLRVPDKQKNVTVQITLESQDLSARVVTPKSGFKL